MSLGVESGKSYGVIEPGATERPDPTIRFSVRPLNEGRFIVEHPFHNGPVTVGDGSAFSDRYIDSAAAVLLDKLPYLADSRKLNRVSRFETRPYASEFAQLSHCISLGLMSREFAGGALEDFDALYNDAPHTYNGHQGDDNYQGHGREDLHDLKRGDFFARSGLIEHLTEAGVLKPKEYGYSFGDTRLHLATLLDEDQATVRPTFVSNKHGSRRMDADRFQYNEEERLLVELFRNRNKKDPLRLPRALAAASLASVTRMVVLEGGEGDQLVFTDIGAAELSTRAYVEHNALHWCEPVQDLVNDLLNLAERYFFVCDDNYARDFQYFYPRDYLHTSASRMFEHFDNVAMRDPFMKWILDLSEKIAKDQRDKMADIIDGRQIYSGPDPLDGITMEPIDGDVASSFDIEGDRMVVLLPKGKMRTVDPRIVTGKQQAQPLSVLRPEIAEDAKDLQAWIGNYRATIELEDPQLIEVVQQGLRLVEENWGHAVKRSPMPTSEFRNNIADANRYVLSGGQAA